MTTFFTDLYRTVVPDMGDRQGPLPPLLVVMTMVTGLVDAFSYLTLGHVFVANMTGNVVLLGFALASAPGFSIAASVLAIAAFALGAVAGGQLVAHFSQHRGKLLAVATAAQCVLFAGAVVLAVTSGTSITAPHRYPLILVLALAMGVQNAATRRLAVPDLTTTVLTLTITGIAADSPVGGGRGLGAGRRTLSVTAILVGALVGAEFIVHVDVSAPLVIALVLAAAVAALTTTLGRSDGAWIHPEAR